MTRGTSGGTVAQKALPATKGRTHLLFLDEEIGRRGRRPADALLLLFASLLAVIATLVADATATSESTVSQAFADLLGWFDVGWQVIYLAALVFGAAVFVESVVLGRWQLVRDQLFALAGLLAVGLVVGRTVSTDWPDVGNGLLSGTGDYPALRLSAVATVLVVTGPALTLPARRLGICLVTLAVPGVAALQIERPSSILGGLAIAVAVAAVIRFALGSSAGFPSRNRVLAGLGELGLPVARLSVAARQRPGAAVFDAVDLDGRDLVVLLVGRDAKDTQVVANAWRMLSLRDPGQGPATGRIQQVEHESLITLLADRSGVRVPEVVEVGRVSSGDAILVLAHGAGPSAEDAPADVTDDFLEHVWQETKALQESGIAHGQLHTGNVLVTPDGPVITNFSLSRLSATPENLQIDVAELLVSTTVIVGPDRALAAARRSLTPERLGTALPYLQRAALTPHTRDLAHDHEVGLKDLRKALAAAAGVKVPDVAPLRRIRLRDIVLMAAVAFAAYLLISQLAEVGFDTIVDQLSMAEWAWVVTALVVAQTTYVTQAISLQGTVVESLPLLPCVVLQSSIKFINLTVPSSAGRIAINIRFLQKLGAPTIQAVAAGAVDTASETLCQIALFLMTLPFVDLHVDLSTDTSDSSGSSSGWLAVLVILATGVVVAVVLLVPSLRTKVMPTVRTAWNSLVTVLKDPRRRLRLFGGNAATQILFATTLGLSCLAYGAHVSLASLVFVNTSVSVFTSILPVPGGIGVAEAGLTAGLTAVGVDPTIAFAAALTHRLCTYYLPPIGGYFSLRWLGRRGYV